MRVCFASYEIHPTTPGGAGVLIAHATRELLSAGAEVLLLLDTPREAFERFDRVDRRGLPNAGACHAAWVGDLAADWPITRDMVPNLFQWQSARFAHALRGALRAFPADVVEFFDFAGAGYYPCMAPLFDLTPGPRPLMQVRTHGPLEVIDAFDAFAAAGPPSPPPDFGRRTLHRLERGAIALADRVVVPSLAFAESHARGAYGVPDARTVVVTPPGRGRGGLGDDGGGGGGGGGQGAEATRPASEGGASDRRTILFVGRIALLKGVDQFVRVACDLFRRRPTLALDVELIGGDSTIQAGAPNGVSLTEHLLASVPTDLRPRLRFRGHVPPAAIREAYGRALFAVFPNRIESYCYALHEAADAGLPLIVRDLAAFRPFFRSGEHALVFGDDAQLLSAMERLIDEPALRRELGRNARERPGHGATGLGVVGPAAVPPRGLELVGVPDVLGLIVGHADHDPFAAQTLRPRTVMQGRAAFLETSGHRGPIAVLPAGSVPEPDWLARCLAALRRRPDLAFAGTWTRRDAGVVPTRFDLDSRFEIPPAAGAHPLVFRDANALRSIVVRSEPTGWARADEPPVHRGVNLHEPLVTLRADAGARG